MCSCVVCVRACVLFLVVCSCFWCVAVVSVSGSCIAASVECSCGCCICFCSCCSCGSCSCLCLCSCFCFRRFSRTQIGSQSWPGRRIWGRGKDIWFLFSWFCACVPISPVPLTHLKAHSYRKAYFCMNQHPSWALTPLSTKVSISFSITHSKEGNSVLTLATGLPAGWD